MSFEDPLAQGDEETEAGAAAGQPADPQASLDGIEGIEAILRGMASQIENLTQEVATLKSGDDGRPARAALPAVETPLAPAVSSADDAPAGSAEAVMASAERARLEAERLEAAALEAKQRAAAAAEEAAHAAENLAAAEGKLGEARSEVETREVAHQRAADALREAEEAVAAEESLLRDARVEQVEARDFVEQARSFKGAEAMVTEAERMLATKDEEVQAAQAAVDEASHRRERAAEAVDRAAERLSEARSGLDEVEAEIRRLRGEAEEVEEAEEAPADLETTSQTEVPETPAEERILVDEPAPPFAPSLSELSDLSPAPVSEASPVGEAEEAEAAEVAEPLVEPSTAAADDDIAARARREREQLEAELRGEPRAPAPVFEAFEDDEDARRLAEQTQAEISGDGLGSGLGEGLGEGLGDGFSGDFSADELHPLPHEAPAPEPQEAPMPWEDPAYAEPAAELPEPEPAMPWEAEAPLTPARRDEGYGSYDEPIETTVPADHVPAYADLDGEAPLPMTPPRAGAYEPAYEAQVPARVESGAALPEPIDILYAIAPDTRQEVGEPASAPARQALQATRAAAEDSRRGKKSAKPKFEALPFDLLVPKQPLIAAFFSPSGGVGKSSTTLNVAALMAAIGAKQAADAEKRGMAMQTPRVLALDGDVVQGSLALRLTGETKPSMHTLQLYLDAREDQGFVGRERWPQSYKLGSAAPGEEPMQKFVHWPDRLASLNLLAAPDDPDKFFDFGPDEYRELLELLGQFYDVILIDCGTEVVMESNRAWLQHAHSVFMLCTPELDRIWNASKAMGYIAKSRPDPEDRSDNPRLLPPLVTREKVSIVMTSSDAETGINLTGEELVGEFFPYIDERQRFFIPDVGRELRKANNAHDFLVLNDQRFAKSIMDIAKHAFNRYASSQRTLTPGS